MYFPTHWLELRVFIILQLGNKLKQQNNALQPRQNVELKKTKDLRIVNIKCNFSKSRQGRVFEQALRVAAGKLLVF